MPAYEYFIFSCYNKTLYQNDLGQAFRPAALAGLQPR
jgi:hypothetical protein